jgi:hypothetical protein
MRILKHNIFPNFPIQRKSLCVCADRRKASNTANNSNALVKKLQSLDLHVTSPDLFPGYVDLHLIPASGEYVT